MAKRAKSGRSSSPKKKPKTPNADKGILVVESMNGKGSKDQYWEVESIVGKRTVKNNMVQYLVRWKGCTAEDDTWEPAENLSDSAYLDAINFEKSMEEMGKETTSNEEEEGGEEVKSKPTKKKTAMKSLASTDLGKESIEKEKDMPVHKSSQSSSDQAEVQLEQKAPIVVEEEEVRESVAEIEQPAKESAPSTVTQPGTEIETKTEDVAPETE